MLPNCWNNPTDCYKRPTRAIALSLHWDSLNPPVGAINTVALLLQSLNTVSYPGNINGILSIKRSPLNLHPKNCDRSLRY
ncbi:hypothetical protein NG796_15495 [Laspinema sp. A4]|uniref:hypothetical protein n=1 Tax=Laspinema sp. D2d TaxID=2953686 RepID=UPI0021BB73FE|nr:hypothetical protein [Laspinema sp. D2d]MCT7984702.1 hypothetical protein [Laspinema sp. D2d]